MNPRGLAVFAALVAVAAQAGDSSSSSRTSLVREAWGEHHPFAIGERTNVRIGEGYSMVSVGGHARLAPWERLHLELFWDNYLALGGPAGMPIGNRHDHEIGFTLQSPLITGRKFTVFPMLGACAMWSFSGNTSDVRFGVHGGVGAQVSLGQGLAVHLELEAIAYNGHQLRAWGFSESVSPNLSWFGVAQTSLGVEYWF
jgi:hypothetical protein